VAKPPNDSRYPLGVGGWIRPRNGIRLKPEKAQKKRGAYPKSGARIVSWRCRKDACSKRVTYPSIVKLFSGVLVEIPKIHGWINKPTKHST
jgi:hypothetical protein